MGGGSKFWIFSSNFHFYDLKFGEPNIWGTSDILQNCFVKLVTSGHFWSLEKKNEAKNPKITKNFEVFNFKTQNFAQILFYSPKKIFSRGNIAKECPLKVEGYFVPL